MKSQRGDRFHPLVFGPPYTRPLHCPSKEAFSLKRNPPIGLSRDVAEAFGDTSYEASVKHTQTRLFHVAGAYRVLPNT